MTRTLISFVIEIFLLICFIVIYFAYNDIYLLTFTGVMYITAAVRSSTAEIIATIEEKKK